MKIITLTLALFLTLFLTALQFSSSQYQPNNYLIGTNEARKAAKVPLVKWNVTLAIYAAKVARGCGRRPRTHEYGINIFVGSVNITASGCVGTWAGQRRCYNPKARRCRRHCKCGAYRLMISRRIKYMGCGRRTCSQKRGCIVCAYWPHRHHIKETEVYAPELTETKLFDEGADFDGEEEEYISGDAEEEEYFDDAEEMEMNDADQEEEYLNGADEEELTAADEGEFSGAEETEYNTDHSNSAESEEAKENGLSTGLASKLGADWLWG